MVLGKKIKQNSVKKKWNLGENKQFCEKKIKQTLIKK